MRQFKYLDQDGEHTVSEEEILRDYFSYWKQQMEKVGHQELVSTENCIQDFVTVHWAWELNKP